MMTFKLSTPQEISAEMGQRLRARRLAANLTQEGLAERSGVPISTLRSFERKGAISFTSFIRLAVTLGDDAALDGLLQAHETYASLDDVLKQSKTPKRGRLK
tara:strand:- start:31 stop:336 length:306 start_codon:yes stop_codon:yes gene_type:complete